jgi:hypothetical protein
MNLPDGLYDQLLTESLRRALFRATDEQSRTLASLSAEDAPERLAEAIAAQIAQILDELQGVPWLFTAGKGSPSLLQEMRRELAACRPGGHPGQLHHRSGVRKLQDVLQQTARRAGQPRTRLRILTTTYTGATEARALDELAACRAARSACRWTAAAPACTPRPGCSSARPASARPMWAAPICRAPR